MQQLLMAAHGKAPDLRVDVDAMRVFRSKLRVLEREIGRCLEEQTDCCGVTVAQCHVLLELDGLRSVNLQALADKLELDKSTLSRAIDSLVGLGLVARKEDPENRRQQILSLSKAGERRVADIHQRCDAYYQQMLARVPTVALAGIVRGIEGLAEAMLAQRKVAGRLQCCRETVAKSDRRAAGRGRHKKSGIDA
jgi:DNA-binding MarR family transcriptional regulator